MIDKATKLELAQIINEAVKRALEGAEERWLTRQQLLEQFGMLSADWVKKNGKFLCPASAVVVDENGRTTITREAYPMHKINRMIQSGEFCFEKKCTYKPNKK